MKQNSRPDKGNRTNRVPFHKRQPKHNLSTIFATNGSSSSVHANQSTKTTSSYITNNPSCTTSPTTSTSTSNSIDSIVAPLSTASQRFVLNAKAKTKKLQKNKHQNDKKPFYQSEVYCYTIGFRGRMKTCISK